MKTLLTDPVVLICSGILLVGAFFLFWAIGKLRGKQAQAGKISLAPSDELFPVRPDLEELSPGPSQAPQYPPGVGAQPAPLAMTPPPAVSKDVAERLESMTQRLSEMQAVLTKQAAAAPPAGSPGAAGIGQGFSPETIDKLLKIIGNVIQQVDILQKSLNLTKDGQ